MPKKTESLTDLYQQFNTIQGKRKQLEGEAKNLKKQEDNLKIKMSSLIKPNTEKQGIFHKYYEKPSISYSKLYDKILKDLVPKTKHPLAEQIKDSFTKVTEYHTFTLTEGE